MTWTRLDDNWTGHPALAALSYEARWHLLCMIQACSRSGRYHGILREIDALRCSDVPDPAGALAALVAAGRILVVPDGYQVVGMDTDHSPPPHLRDENRKPAGVRRTRKWREQKQLRHKDPAQGETRHVTGDVTRDVTGDVTRDIDRHVTVTETVTPASHTAAGNVGSVPIVTRHPAGSPATSPVTQRVTSPVTAGQDRTGTYSNNNESVFEQSELEIPLPTEPPNLEIPLPTEPPNLPLGTSARPPRNSLCLYCGAPGRDLVMIAGDAVHPRCQKKQANPAPRSSRR